MARFRARATAIRVDRPGVVQCLKQWTHMGSPALFRALTEQR